MARINRRTVCIQMYTSGMFFFVFIFWFMLFLRGLCSGIRHQLSVNNVNSCQEKKQKVYDRSEMGPHQTKHLTFPQVLKFDQLNFFLLHAYFYHHQLHHILVDSTSGCTQWFLNFFENILTCSCFFFTQTQHWFLKSKEQLAVLITSDSLRAKEKHSIICLVP